MIRIRLGVNDLAQLKLTFAPLGRFCELAASAQVLQQPASQFRRYWRAHSAELPPRARQLLQLVPAHGNVPDFLAPEGSGCLDEAIDTILATPAPTIRTELAGATRTTPWLKDLACGRVAARRELGRVLRSYHQHVAIPLWPALQHAAAADVTERARQLAMHGAAAVLNDLDPRIRWAGDGMLEVDAPASGDIDLAGRGLCLVPTIISRPAFPLGWTQPALCYPLPARHWQALITGTPSTDPLPDVLGATRAKVLRALDTEHTTSGLAQELGISLAAASMHTSTLHAAGLVSSWRDGRAVRHVRTPLGEQMATTADRTVIPGKVTLAEFVKLK